MKRLAIIICASLLLGGCNITLGQIFAYKQGSLEFAKVAIRSSCSAIGVAETEAASAAISVKVSKIRAAVQAICNNVDLLTDDVIGNYVAAIGRAVRDAKAAQVGS